MREGHLRHLPVRHVAYAESILKIHFLKAPQSLLKAPGSCNGPFLSRL